MGRIGGYGICVGATGNPLHGRLCSCRGATDRITEAESGDSEPRDKEQEPHCAQCCGAACTAIPGGCGGGFLFPLQCRSIGIVDDPRQAVQRAEKLVAQVIKSRAERFSNARTNMEDQFKEGGDAATANVRVALRTKRDRDGRAMNQADASLVSPGDPCVTELRAGIARGSISLTLAPPKSFRLSGT